MFNPFRLIKNIIYLTILVGIAFGVINYSALLKQAEYYFYQKYPKAEVLRVVLEYKKKPEIPKDNRLVIPTLHLDAPIREAESDSEAMIQKALEDGVVHYPGTASAGEVGNFFILGHSSDYIWRHGQYKDVFALLNKLQKDDLIQIIWEGKEYLYQVETKKIVSENDVDILSPTEKSIISLMTCWPIGTSLKRLVVIGTLRE